MIEFLTSFLNLFDAYIIRYEMFEERIAGTVGWLGEDDTQDFAVEIVSGDYLLEIKKLCDFIKENSLIDIDKIVITEDELLLFLSNGGWDISIAKDSINNLCSFEVKMVDSGQETDSFFVHF